MNGMNIDASLTRDIQAVVPTGIVYKARTVAGDDRKIRYVNYTVELQDLLGGKHVVLLGERLSEAKASISAMVRAMKARSKRIGESSAALDPTCRVCGLLDCPNHRGWKFCTTKNHASFWNPDVHLVCPSCQWESR